MTSITKKLLQQRIRNRIIEYFDLSYEEIAKFGAFEIINMWQDFVPEGWDENFFKEPVFSKKEQAHIKQFCEIWGRTAEATPADIFDKETLQNSIDWSTFVSEAKKAHKLFEERGKFSEEVDRF